MPKEVFTKDYQFLSSSQQMSFDEMLKLAKGFVSLGVEKIRITGGEPLLRKNVEKLIESLARLATPNGKDVSISLTTNGTLLASKARALKDAGLQRVTVSLDSLDNDIFMKMNDVGVPVKTVLEAIETAQAVGLSPVKVNTVVQKGVNESQILPIAEYFRNTGVIVRFIEYMDVGGAAHWSESGVLTSTAVRQRIEQAHSLLPAPQERGSDTAQRYLYADGAGEVGFISSVSEPFCGACSRARVSVDGKMFLCLFATDSVNLRPYLSEKYSPAELEAVIRSSWEKRGDRYSELREEHYANPGKKIYPTVRMSLVGG